MDHIGSYRLLKLIRAGSTTHVWEAMNPADNKRLAIKSLQPEYRTDKNEIAGLKHEYTVGSTLDHPNVNPVFEYSNVRGVPFVVMNYFKAPNLKQAIRLSPEVVKAHRKSIVTQSALGLHHLHEQGWIHRDIKPDNFLFHDSGELRLIDFALAIKRKAKSRFGSMFGGKSRIVGTRSYMSPEQIRGEYLGPQADLYSLGCVIFELYAGRPPFTGTSADELLNKHLRSPAPALASMADDVPSKLSALILRTMEKKPDKRHDSVEEFLEEFQSIRVIRRKK